jgi:hypothetical protein
MPVWTRICLLTGSTDSTLVIFSSRSVTEVMLLAGLMAEGAGAATEVRSGTGLLAQSGWVRWELPGHTNGAVLWKALHAMTESYTHPCFFELPCLASVIWCTAGENLQLAGISQQLERVGRCGMAPMACGTISCCKSCW